MNQPYAGTTYPVYHHLFSNPIVAWIAAVVIVYHTPSCCAVYVGWEVDLGHWCRIMLAVGKSDYTDHYLYFNYIVTLVPAAQNYIILD